VDHYRRLCGVIVFLRKLFSSAKDTIQGALRATVGLKIFIKTWKKNFWRSLASMIGKVFYPPNVVIESTIAQI